MCSNHWVRLTTTRWESGNRCLLRRTVLIYRAMLAARAGTARQDRGVKKDAWVIEGAFNHTTPVPRKKRRTSPIASASNFNPTRATSHLLQSIKTSRKCCTRATIQLINHANQCLLKQRMWLVIVGKRRSYPMMEVWWRCRKRALSGSRAIEMSKKIQARGTDLRRCR